MILLRIIIVLSLLVFIVGCSGEISTIEKKVDSQPDISNSPKEEVKEESKDVWPPPNVVKAPGEGGGLVIYNELLITAGQDTESFVAEFGGDVTDRIPGFGHRVRFPVSSLEELEVIVDKLREKDSNVQVSFSYIPIPS